MPDKQHPQPPAFGGPPPRNAFRAHIVPTDQQRSAADAFLRGDSIEPAMRELVELTVREFGWAENGYIEEARTQGEQSRIWDTTRWIIANAMARHAAPVRG